MALLKYFFLSDSWTTGRVWEFGGLWDERSKRRLPHLKKLSLCIQENDETLCLFQTEDAVLMLEVVPKAPEAETGSAIGQVVLKRLLTADQVIERLCQEGGLQSMTAESLETSRQSPLHPPLHPNSDRPVLNPNGNMPVSTAVIQSSIVL